MLRMREAAEQPVRQAADDVDDQEIGALVLCPARRIINRVIGTLGPVRRYQDAFHRSLLAII
jgi:hypothetical protein